MDFIKAARERTLAAAESGRQFVVQLNEQDYENGEDASWDVWDTYRWQTFATGLTWEEAEKLANVAEKLGDVLAYSVTISPDNPH